jgi:hypothetical protein
MKYYICTAVALFLLTTTLFSKQEDEKKHAIVKVDGDTLWFQSVSQHHV